MLKKYLFSFSFIFIIFSSFVTITPAETAPTYPFRFVQVSDTQPDLNDDNQWQRVNETVELINSLEPDFVIFPGDITVSVVHCGAGLRFF